MADDKYYTPLPVARALIAKLVEYGDIQNGDQILDPSSGKGAFGAAIQETLIPAFVTTIDLDPDVEADAHCDFLAYDDNDQFNLIVTNPPFSQWQKFVDHAVELLDPRGTVAYLLRLGALGPSVKQGRREFLNRFPCSTIDILRPRPSFKGGSDNSEYALFRWLPQDFEGLRKTGKCGTIGFIDWEKPNGRERKAKVVAAEAAE